MADLALQLLLVALLLLTIAWCVLVHLRLRRFRLERGELQGLIDALTIAAERAEAATAGLKETGRRVEDEVGRQNRQALAVIDELRRLGGGAPPSAPAGERRRAARPPSEAAPAAAARPAGGITAGVKAELIEALAALR